MTQSLKRIIAAICTIILVLALLPCPSVAAEDSQSEPYVPLSSAWEQECDWSGKSTFFHKNDGTVVIQNSGANVFTLTQYVPVKPKTTYCFSALVRMKDYRQCETAPSGASVRFGSAYGVESYTNDFVTSSEWRRSCVYFTTGEQTTMQLSLAVGMWSGACEGTAYFRDMVLEEIKIDNRWNMLALIYTTVETPEYSNSFSERDVRELQSVLNAYPETVNYLSGGRMLIEKLDIQIIDEPIRSVSGGDGNLTHGPDQDIDFDLYLEKKDYHLIAVYAPLGGHPKNTGWAGLSGCYYTYRGHPIFDLIISNVFDHDVKPYYVRGERYDLDTAMLLHETLHSVETNSRDFNGWAGFTAVHDNAAQGYTYSEETDYLHWYSALMRDDGLDGKGFKPCSFFVRHLPDSQLADTPVSELHPNPFVDVPETAYYYDAVLWAYDHAVTKGTGDMKFSPDATCTRGQVVTFLWRAMGCPEPMTAENPFGDVTEDAYYRDAVLWAVENGITKGTGTDQTTGLAVFDPEDTCSYAHILTFLWRTVTGKYSSAYGKWYSEPLDWAENTGLLLNTPLGAGTCSMEDDCPRSDVAAFLYHTVG